ncbi:PREDICTED: uncharacterized protein LOC108767580 [Trachymyrmex cornetzi]|uniref:uncharacterized protein LOC108767580 n=1 Tax=Trachymyrmex cornetzi TaxID=471704 RepID=UPI00084EE13E|nr:PREDICTED: uncharacterized protein LOC108767580 [Trachymyrmex cornetzi]
MLIGCPYHFTFPIPCSDSVFRVHGTAPLCSDKEVTIMMIDVATSVEEEAPIGEQQQDRQKIDKKSALDFLLQTKYLDGQTVAYSQFQLYHSELQIDHNMSALLW